MVTTVSEIRKRVKAVRAGPGQVSYLLNDGLADIEFLLAEVDKGRGRQFDELARQQAFMRQSYPGLQQQRGSLFAPGLTDLFGDGFGGLAQSWPWPLTRGGG